MCGRLIKAFALTGTILEITITAVDGGDIHQQCAVKENQSISQSKAVTKMLNCTFDLQAIVCVCVHVNTYYTGAKAFCVFTLVHTSFTMHAFRLILKPLFHKTNHSISF